MKQKKKTNLFILSGVFAVFSIIFTILVMNFDVKPIGPDSSRVGFASINESIFNLLGTSDLWYEITEVLGIVAVLVAVCFAILGLVQCIQRKSLWKVDKNIFVLAGLYALVVMVYIFFEFFIVNYRPVLVNGVLEASFPSSHTMLICCILASALYPFHQYIKNKPLCTALSAIACLVIVVVVVGRLLSGMHWFTDIVAGLLFSATLVSLYYGVVLSIKEK